MSVSVGANEKPDLPKKTVAEGAGQETCAKIYRFPCFSTPRGIAVHKSTRESGVCHMEHRRAGPDQPEEENKGSLQDPRARGCRYCFPARGILSVNSFKKSVFVSMVPPYQKVFVL